MKHTYDYRYISFIGRARIQTDYILHNQGYI
jgi:hypothetical protein